MRLLYNKLDTTSLPVADYEYTHPWYVRAPHNTPNAIKELSLAHEKRAVTNTQACLISRKHSNKNNAKCRY